MAASGAAGELLWMTLVAVGYYMTLLLLLLLLLLLSLLLIHSISHFRAKVRFGPFGIPGPRYPSILKAAPVQLSALPLEGSFCPRLCRW